MTLVRSELSESSIPAEIQAFYDPNDTFSGSSNPEEALLTWLETSREQPVFAPYLGKIAAKQVVAVELAHAGMIDRNTDAAWLGISEADTERAISSVETYSSSIARSCLAAVTNIRRSRPAVSLRDVSDITLAGAVLSANAHNNQWRLNDKPYYTHPRDVALLVGAAYKTHLTAESDPNLPLYEFEALLHDGFEDSFPEDGSSFLKSPNIITSPAVLYEVLKQVGVGESIARRQAMGLIALTKTVGPDDSMTYWPYVERFEKFATQIPTKIADLQHNYQIDSKVPQLGGDEATKNKNKKLYLKRNEYSDAQKHLLSVYGQSEDVTSADDWFRKHLFASKILTLTKKDLQDARNSTPWARVDSTELVQALETNQ